MIARAGIVIGIVLIIAWLIEHLRTEFNVHSDIPTQKELDALPNKLNELALKRSNERKIK